MNKQVWEVHKAGCLIITETNLLPSQASMIPLVSKQETDENGLNIAALAPLAILNEGLGRRGRFAPAHKMVLKTISLAYSMAPDRRDD